MLELKSVCDACESMTSMERGLLIAEKSIKILTKLHCLDINGIDPVDTLAGFLIGSVAADGTIDEQEYILIYPALVQVFGNDFDYNSVKKSFRRGSEGKKTVDEYTEDMLRIFDYLDDTLKADVITLCLCVVAIDGRISLKERLYIKRLCKA